MADEADKTIIDVEVKGGDVAEDQMKSLNALTAQLTKYNEELLATNKALESQGKTSSKVYSDNTDQIQDNQKAINKNHAEVKTLGAQLKNSSEATKKQTLSTQQMTDGLDKAVPGLGGFVNGIMAATKASLAFVATPLGIVLVPIIAALAAVATYFTRTEEGGDKLAKAWAQLQAVAGVLLDRFAAVGSAISSLISLDFAGASDKMAEAIKGVGDEIEREIKVAGKLADLLDGLEDRELAYGVAASKTTNEIRLLMIASKNRTLTEQEKIAKLTEAFNLEVDQNKVLTGIGNDKLHAAVEQFQQDAKTAAGKRLQNETDIDYANRIIGLTGETVAARSLVGEAIKNINSIEGESLNLQEKLSNQIDSQNEKLKAKWEAAGAATLKQLEIDKAADVYYAQKAVLDQQKFEADAAQAMIRAQAKIDGELALSAQIIAIGNEEAAAEQAAANKSYDQYVANENKKAAMAKVVEDNKLRLQQQGMAAVGSLLKQGTAEYKAYSIATTLISTYTAAQKAYESQLVPLDPTSIGRAIAAAIFSVVQGLGRVATIAGFEQGGDVFTIGGRRHSEGGTKFFGEDGTKFEAEKGEGLFILKREAQADFIREQSLRNMKFGGRSWFGNGGAVERFALGGNIIPIGQSAQTQANQSQLLDIMISAISALPPPQVAVVDINAGQASRNQVEVTATI